jgi:precorrin-3B synthase
MSASPWLGVVDTAAIDRLASLAGEDTTVHPTPQRGILLVGPASRADELRAAAGELAACGWVVTGSDPRRDISACIGSRGCGAGLVDTQAVAATLLGTGRVHVSGCDKRCGAPGDTRELVATDDGLLVECWP